MRIIQYPSSICFTLLISCILMLSAPTLLAQESLGSKVIPIAGDIQPQVNCWLSVPETYYTPDDRGNYNFSFVSFPYVSENKFADRKEGKYYAYFPSADLVLLKTNGEEEYYQIVNDNLYLQGRTIISSFTKSNMVVQKYTPAVLVANPSWKEGQKYSVIYKASIKAAVEDLSSRYGAIPAGTDSIMIENLVRESATVGGWSDLQLFESTQQVQSHRASFRSKYYFKVKAEGADKWTTRKVTRARLPIELQDATRDGESKRHKFYSRAYKGIYMQYDKWEASQINEKESPILMSFQDDVNPIKIRKTTLSGPDVIAYPNPTYGPINFEILGLSPQDLRLEVYNIIGKKIYEKSYSKRNGLVIKEDLSFLSKGTYLYSIINAQGRKIKTKRVSIMGI